MKSIWFLLCASLLLQTIIGISTPSSCNDENESENESEDENESENETESEEEDMRDSDEDCNKGQKCCNVGCFKECVDPMDTPEITTVNQQTKSKILVPCSSQSDCGKSQCCTNATTGAQTGICQDRKQITDDCHNPNPTGFYRSQCPGPSKITHPDLCPCDCDYLCSPGFPDQHGGYRGICMFD